MYILTDVHKPIAEGNFCDECRIAHKPAIIEDYSRHLGYVDKGDRMANSYPLSRRTWKWTKKLFFHLLDPTILYSYIIRAYCGCKINHLKCCLTLVKNVFEMSARGTGLQSSPRGRPNTQAKICWK
jgi:hypothetical protein